MNQSAAVHAKQLDRTFGRASLNRLRNAGTEDENGALAALETLCYAFNSRNIEALEAVWFQDSPVRLNNPVGGIFRGSDEIVKLYARVFDGPVRAWVEFTDIVQYTGPDTMIFADSERDHGSIDDPASLAAYQNAVRGSR